MISGMPTVRPPITPIEIDGKDEPFAWDFRIFYPNRTKLIFAIPPIDTQNLSSTTIPYPLTQECGFNLLLLPGQYLQPSTPW
jgi:hypothetical protein